MLSKKHRLFVGEYLKDPASATSAAIKAGVPVKGAHVTAHRWLKTPAIIAAIAAAQGRVEAKALAQYEISVARTLSELAKVGYADIGEVYDTDGNIKPIHLLPAGVRAAIQSVEVIIKNAKAGDGVTDTVLKLRHWDKVRALELMMKHLGLLVEKVEISGTVTLEEKIARARQQMQKP